MENNATHAHSLVQRLCPDELLVPASCFSFSLLYGGLHLSGYYSLLGGGAQIQSVIDGCHGLNGGPDGLTCANSAAQAVVAHSLAAFVGGTYGTGHMAYIARYAGEATGMIDVVNNTAWAH